MKPIAIIVALLTLGACSLTDRTAGVDIRVVQQCAKLHPPPRQMNVERLGLLPVYFTHASASDDAATQQWYADMDACTTQSKPASK